MGVEDEAKAVGDYWEGHPEPREDGATPQELAAYEKQMTTWGEKFGEDGPPDPPAPPAVPGPPSPGAGMPAARIGDLCAHGGTIVGPGCPTVLIGGMVAVRAMPAMDQAACPMFNGPVAHATGTILKGSMTVLIGNMPAARVSDPIGPPTVCAGNAIALGCFTVLIGDAGGGGAGAGAGAAAAAGGADTQEAAGGPAAEQKQIGPGTTDEITSTDTQAGPAVAEEPPPKEPPVRTGCHVVSLTLQCQHSAEKPRTPLVVTEATPKNRATLSVVPSEGKVKVTGKTGIGKVFSFRSGSIPAEPRDVIDLTVADKCALCEKGSHPVWKLDQPIEPPPGSKKATLSVKAWPVGKAVPWIPDVTPQRYSVTANACENKIQAYVEAYPCDTLDLDFDLLTIWDVFTDILTNGLRGAVGSWAADLRRSLDPVKKDLKGKTKAAAKKARQNYGKDKMAEKDSAKGKLKEKSGMGQLAKKLKMNVFDLSIEGHWGAHWREHTDHRAFYGYDFNIKGGVLGGWRYDFSLISLFPGMQWYQAVPSDIRKGIADAYVYVALTAELTLTGGFKRETPDTSLWQHGGAELKGSPKITLGGGAVIANGKIAKVTVQGSTGVDLTGVGGIDAQGWYFKGSVQWPGVEGQVEAVLFDDVWFMPSIGVKETYTLIKPSKSAAFRLPKSPSGRA